MTRVLALLSRLDSIVIRLIVMKVLREGRSHWRLLKARGVGRGLGAKLSEVEVGASAVADVHGLVKAALGEDAVGDNAVNGDGDDFDNDFDEGTD